MIYANEYAIESLPMIHNQETGWWVGIGGWSLVIGDWGLRRFFPSPLFLISIRGHSTSFLLRHVCFDHDFYSPKKERSFSDKASGCSLASQCPDFSMASLRTFSATACTPLSRRSPKALFFAQSPVKARQYHFAFFLALAFSILILA